MNNYNNNFPQYNSYYPINPELSDLKKRANTVGLITIISVIVFYAVSSLISIAFRTVLMQYPVAENIDSLPDSIYGGLVNLLALGVGGAIFIKLKKDDITQQLPFRKVEKSTLISIIIIGFSACMLSNFMTSLYLGSTSNLGFDFDYSSNAPLSNSIIEIVMSALATAFVPAIAEEILFRGAIMSTLRKYGDATAILVSAVIFGLFHTNLVQIPFAFVVGLILGWAVVYSGSMLPAILIHFTNNLFSVISSTLQTNAESWNLSQDVISISVSVFVIIVSVCTIMCAMKFSRKDKTFLSLNNYNGELKNSQISKTIITNPGIVAAVSLLVIETINKHITI